IAHESHGQKSGDVEQIVTCRILNELRDECPGVRRQGMKAQVATAVVVDGEAGRRDVSVDPDALASDELSGHPNREGRAGRRGAVATYGRGLVEARRQHAAVLVNEDLVPENRR